VTVPAFLALDLGTSELKAGLLTTDGSLVAEASATYGTDLDPVTGRAEQDPAEWWAGLRSVVTTLRRSPGVSIAGICVVGQGPSLVAADDVAEPTRPCITWLDTRPGADAAELERATGVGGWSLGVTPAARWVERHEPEVAARTAWYLDSWDWIAYRLTGVPVASRARGQRTPEPSAIEGTGLPGARLPPVVATGRLQGVVRGQHALDLGLDEGIPVVAGCVDAYASFFGAGLEAPGDAIDTGGSSGGFAVYGSRHLPIEGTFVIEAPVPGRWLYGGAMAATGQALDWLAAAVLREPEVPRLLSEAASVAPGADGLVFLPYLAGERSPIWDPAARGVFSGLSLAHGRGHLVRAVLEAAAFALRHVAEPIREAGIDVREVRVSGGTARSGGWNRIKADVLGVPVAVPEVVDTALMGAAVIAAVGLGGVDSFESGMRRLVRFRERIEPDPAARGVYDAAFERYRALYPALVPTMHALHPLRDDR